MWECFHVNRESSILGVRTFFGLDASHIFLRCAGRYPLDRGCSGHCDQSLHWMLGGASSLLHGCHSHVSGEVCSPLIAVEVLRVRFNKAPLYLSICSAPKEVSPEANETHCGHGKPMCYPCRCPRFCPEAAQGHIPFSVVFIPDLVLSWWRRPEHRGCRN